MRTRNGSPLQCHEPGNRITRGRSITVRSLPKRSASARCTDVNVSSGASFTHQYQCQRPGDDSTTQCGGSGTVAGSGGVTPSKSTKYARTRRTLLALRPLPSPSFTIAKMPARCALSLDSRSSFCAHEPSTTCASSGRLGVRSSIVWNVMRPPNASRNRTVSSSPTAPAPFGVCPAAMALVDTVAVLLHGFDNFHTVPGAEFNLVDGVAPRQPRTRKRSLRLDDHAGIGAHPLGIKTNRGSVAQDIRVSSRWRADKQHATLQLARNVS